MRRVIAVLVSLPVGLCVVYLAVCVFAGRAVHVDQAERIAEQHWILAFVLLATVASGYEEWLAKTRARTVAGCVLLVLVVSFVYLTGLETSSPEESLEQARAAYMQRDLATFKSYVDVNAVLSDGIDQIVVSPLAQSATHSDSAFGGIVAAGVAVTAASWKQVYLPRLSEQVEQFVVTGSVPDQSQDDAFGVAMGSEILRMLAASQLTYEGIEGTRKLSDSFALVTVRVQVSSNAQPNQEDMQGRELNSDQSPALLTLKMRSAGGHWQIVGIQNLPELAKRLLG